MLEMREYKIEEDFWIVLSLILHCEKNLKIFINRWAEESTVHNNYGVKPD